jgi:hypothetical protein
MAQQFRSGAHQAIPVFTGAIYIYYTAHRSKLLKTE